MNIVTSTREPPYCVAGAITSRKAPCGIFRKPTETISMENIC
jgi:hypothetical protein